MKKSQVEIGKVYAAKISGKIQPVRITGVNQYGGWNGRNETTGREIHIKSAQKLRYQIAEQMVDLAVKLARCTTCGERPAYVMREINGKPYCRYHASLVDGMDY